MPSRKDRQEPKKKAELRRRMAAARDALPREEVAERSKRIRERLLDLPEVQAAASLFVYVSERNEVDTHELIRSLLRQGKTILVPLIRGPGIMEAHRIEAFDDLAPGEFGILAPAKQAPFEGTPDLSICPGLAFTRRGDRLGRGAAYYDRFLAGHPRTFAAGLCYEFQLVDEIPIGPGDMHVRLIVTEDRTIRISPER